VSRAFLMRRFTAFAGDIALLRSIHRCKSAILFCHARPPASTPGLQPMYHGSHVSRRKTMT
jgi:hypothetical protein